MKNCIILGAGRSGTSMVTGSLAKAGYFMGNHLHAPEPSSNAKGFFEDEKINLINEHLLAQVIPKRPPLIGDFFYRNIPKTPQRWLAQVKIGAEFSLSDKTRSEIQSLVSNSPYCFKDPRFSYTLPAWKPFLKQDTVFICVFREPNNTVESILRECKTREYLKSLFINYEMAVNVWLLMYKHILEIHHFEGEWLFLHTNQVLTKDGLDKLHKITDSSVDYDFPDRALSRQNSEPVYLSEEVKRIYKKLCRLAEYEIG